MSGENGSGPRGKRAPNTTIVGGQPPVDHKTEQTSDELPNGLEQMLAMAAVDDAFADKLCSDRQKVLDESDIALNATERSVLLATPEPALRAMITRVANSLVDAQRRSFITRAAAALALVSGGGLLMPSCDRTQVSKGVRPDRPKKRPKKLEVETGHRVDRPPRGVEDKPKTTDEPQPSSKAAPKTSQKIAGVQARTDDDKDDDKKKKKKKPKPKKPIRTRGISPDRPPRKAQPIAGLDTRGTKKDPS
jgi:Mg-chelatase subunit ChlI